MNLAISTSPKSPADVFTAACSKFRAAADAITFAPNEGVDVGTAIGLAVGQTIEAAVLLSSCLANRDVDTELKAYASVASAETAVHALENARMANGTRGPAGGLIGASPFLELAKRNLKNAEIALGME